MSGSAEFDIDPVVPHVDLVLFDNVLSCYPYVKDITVNYTLGEAVRPTTWDWVGVFRTDWRYLGEYVAYSWVPDGTDVTNPRRRGIAFPAGSHKIQPSDDEEYNFLYIAHGNHVVGVSSPFRVVDEEKLDGLGIELLFSVPREEAAALRSPSEEEFHRLTCSGFHDSYEIIEEACQPSSGAIPKKKASCKRKITKVYRDSTTLVNMCPTWPEKLRILDVHPVVQEYMDNRLRTVTNPSAQQVVPVFDAQWKNKAPKQQASNGQQQIVASYIPSIEYPEILSITAGPESFLLGLKSSTKTCPNCCIAKTLMKDLMDKDDKKDKRIAELEEQVRELKSTQVSRIDKETTVGILDWCLEQLSDDNKDLRLRNKDLEKLLVDERTKSFKSCPVPKSPTVDTGSLAKTIHTEAKETQSTAVPEASLQFSIDHDGWTYKQPRKIERLQRAVLRHSRTIELLHQTMEAKKYQITSLREENLQLRRLLRNEKDQTQVFCKLADELNTRIKAVLAERAKKRTNEWRKLFSAEPRDKSVYPVPCPTPCPTPTLSSDSESQEKTRETTLTKDTIVRSKNSTKSNTAATRINSKAQWHKERAQAEQCRTCGLKFSMKTDRKVIQEHANFHMRNRRKQ